MTSISSLLFPVVCPSCGAQGSAPCVDCAASCDRSPVVAPLADVDDVLAVLSYDGLARDAIVGLKYRNGRSVIPWLTSCLAGEITRRWPDEPFDVVTWIPSLPSRQRQRGFDQGRLLAVGVAAKMGLPCRRLLTRSGSKQQTGAPRVERLAGPRLRPRRGCTSRDSVDIRVLLIDDVVTTGASISTAARVLRSIGASSVSAAVVASTPPGAGHSRRLELGRTMSLTGGCKSPDQN